MAGGTRKDAGHDQRRFSASAGRAGAAHGTARGCRFSGSDAAQRRRGDGRLGTGPAGEVVWSGAELAPRTVLDAGCGEGEMLRRGVLPEGSRPVCLDLRISSLAEVAAAKRVCARVQALPFSTCSFDMVMCLEVLEHLDDPGSAVR